MADPAVREGATAEGRPQAVTQRREKPPAVVSFDVFDTLVTRGVGEPVGAFRRLGALRSDLLALSNEEFVHARVSAERRARAHRPADGEPTLDEIYDELRASLRLPVAAAEELLSAELAVERSLSLPVVSGVEELASWARQGVRCVATSDTYFPEDFVRELLEQAGALPHLSALYLSSTHRASKATGRLFDVLLAAERVPPDAVLHLGDNPWSDVRQPARCGMRAEHRPAASQPLRGGPGAACGEHRRGVFRAGGSQPSRAPRTHARRPSARTHGHRLLCRCPGADRLRLLGTGRRPRSGPEAPALRLTGRQAAAPSREAPGDL